VHTTPGAKHVCPRQRTGLRAIVQGDTKKIATVYTKIYYCIQASSHKLTATTPAQFGNPTKMTLTTLLMEEHKLSTRL